MPSDRVALPPHVPGMRIGLFGGTFDPPHDAHLEACLIAMKRLALDRVWWLVTPGNPLKDTRGLAPLQQRIAVRSTLGALQLEEAYDYLLHHLRQAGAKADQVIDDSALETLARGTGGVPRRLNQAAHLALSLADAGELSCVDAEAALEALTLLGLSAEEPAESEIRILASRAA